MNYRYWCLDLEDSPIGYMKWENPAHSYHYLVRTDPDGEYRLTFHQDSSSLAIL